VRSAWPARRRAAGSTEPGLAASVYDFLLTLRQGSAHGGPFAYRSCESDVLGWVCERAAGARMPELMSGLLWGSLGAEHDADLSLDHAGLAVHDGGLSAALRDLVRFGQMLADGGRSMTGQQVLPAWWVRDAPSRLLGRAGPGPTANYLNYLTFRPARTTGEDADRDLSYPNCAEAIGRRQPCSFKGRASSRLIESPPRASAASSGDLAGVMRRRNLRMIIMRHAPAARSDGGVCRGQTPADR
jgi:hypothetical protein